MADGGRDQDIHRLLQPGWLRLAPGARRQARPIDADVAIADGEEMRNIVPLFVDDCALDVRHRDQANALPVEVARGRPTDVPESLQGQRRAAQPQARHRGALGPGFGPAPARGPRGDWDSLAP